MKKIFFFTAFVCSILSGQNVLMARPYASVEDKQHADKSLITGFDGGMMLHSGYLHGNIAALDYSTKGAPFGIGGVLRLHLGDKWRVGTEGYMSKFNQMNNGSHIKYVWGGFLADYSLRLGDFSLFAGLTLGGGANTDVLMFEEPAKAWDKINNTVYQKIPFWAIDPFVGCEYALSEALRLSLKLDYLRPVAADRTDIPTGHRVYVGLIFAH